MCRFYIGGTEIPRQLHGPVTHGSDLHFILECFSSGNFGRTKEFQGKGKRLLPCRSYLLLAISHRYAAKASRSWLSLAMPNRCPGRIEISSLLSFDQNAAHRNAQKQGHGSKCLRSRK